MTSYQHPLVGKYVISPIDNKVYCRKNGQFLQHIIKSGFDGYQNLFETFFPDKIRRCLCGRKCIFKPTTMSYLKTCGNKACANKVSSTVKQGFTREQHQRRLEKYKATMESKSPEELREIKHAQRKAFLERYGVDHPWKHPTVRQKISKTTERKYGQTNYSSTLIPEDSKKLLENHEWLFDLHVTQQTPLYVIANQLNVSDRTVGVYLKKHGIQTHSFQRSFWETELQKRFDKMGVKYVFNCRDIIPPKEVDFYLPEYNIAIELCGLYWHCEAHERVTKKFHVEKFNLCQNKNIKLLTIFEDEWDKKDIIFNSIDHLLNRTVERKYARSLKIIDNVDFQSRKQFLEQHHIQGNGKGSISIGMCKNNELYALGLFKKEKCGVYILQRFCTRGSVVGGFSKILHYFESKYNIKQLITFADNRWSTGDVYLKHGFVLENILPPDYSYVVNGKRVHKFNFRHKHLKTKLKEYDPQLSERENCFNNGLYRVWDCGKMRFVKNYE